MKKTIFNLIILLFMTSFVNAQTEENVDDRYKKYCKGICLIQKEFNSDSITEHQFGLMRKKTARFYLFKEESKIFPNIDIYDHKGNHITNFETFYFEEENYMYIEYKSPYHRIF